MFIISGCLLGDNCRYDGGNKRTDDVVEFSRSHSYIPVCPELEGGLSTPRPPAEQQGESVFDCEGKDLTDAFTRGAELTIDMIDKEAARRGEKIEGAILRKKSPSCGSGRVYDGSFSGTLISGDGVFAGMLKKRGIKIVTEDETEIFR